MASDAILCEPKQAGLDALVHGSTQRSAVILLWRCRLPDRSSQCLKLAVQPLIFGARPEEHIHRASKFVGAYKWILSQINLVVEDIKGLKRTLIVIVNTLF